MELMVLLRIVVIFLSVHIGLGMRCLGWVVLSVLLVGSILGVCDLWQGMLWVRPSAMTGWVVWLSEVRAMGMLLAISRGVVGLCVRADAAMTLWRRVSLTVLHEVGL